MEKKTNLRKIVLRKNLNKVKKSCTRFMSKLN